MLANTALSCALASLITFSPAVIDRALAQSTWNNVPSAAWSDAAQWTPATVPNAVDASARFNATAGVSAGVDLAGGPFTVGLLSLKNAVAGGFSFQQGTIAMSSATTARINVETSNITADVANGGALRLDSNTVVQTVGPATFTVAGAISGVGGLTKSGDGVMTISAPASYSGATRVVSGRLVAGATNAFSVFSALSIDASGTVDLGGANQAVGSLRGTAGAVVTTSGAPATLRAGSDGTNGTFAGSLQDGAGGQALGLTKVGTTTLTLSGANTHTGATDVAFGRLVISGTGSLVGSGGVHSDVTVRSGARLDVNGGGLAQVASLNVASGGTLVNNGSIEGFGASITIAGAAVTNVKMNDATDINVSAGGTLDAQGELSAPLVVNAGTFTVTGALSGVGTGPHVGPIDLVRNVGVGQTQINAAFTGLTDFVNTSTSASAVNVAAAGQLVAGGDVTNAAGTFTNAGVTTAGGDIRNAAGATLTTTNKLNAAGDIANAGTMSAAGEVSATNLVNTGTFTVTGALTGVGTGPHVGPIALVRNAGTGQFRVNAAFAGLTDFVNTSAAANAVNVAAAGQLVAGGDVTNSAGTFANAGVTTAGGDIRNAAGATLTTTGKLNAAGDISNAGTMNAAGEVSATNLVNTGTFTVTGALTGVGTGPHVGPIALVRNAGTGQFLVNAAFTGLTDFVNTSTSANAVNVAAAGQLAALGNVTNAAGTFTNAGQVTAGGNIANTGGTFLNSGVATAGGNISNAAGATLTTTNKLNAVGAIVNAGTMNAAGEVSATEIRNSGLFTVTAALTGVGTGPHAGPTPNFNNIAGGSLLVNANFGGLVNLTNTSALANAVRVAAGATLTATGTVANNAGTFTNLGTTSAANINNAATLTSTGALTATAALNNSGVFNVSGTINAPSLINSGVMTVTGAQVGAVGATNNSGQINVTAAGATATLGALTNTGVVNMVGGGATNIVNAIGAYTGGGQLLVDVALDTGAADRLNLGGGAASNTTVGFVFSSAGVHADAVVVTNAGAATFTSAAVVPTANPSPFGIAGAQMVRDDGIVQQWFGQSAAGNWVVRSDVNAAALGSVMGTVSGLMSSITTAFSEPASAFISKPQDDSPNKFSIGAWGRNRDGRFNIKSSSLIPGLGVGGVDRIVESRARATFIGFQLGLDAGLYNINNSGWSANVGVHGGYIDGESKTPLAKLDVQQPFYGVYGALSNGPFALDVLIRRDQYNLRLTPTDLRILAAGYGGKFKGDGWSALANVQYRFTIGENLFLEPSAAIMYSRIELGKFQTAAGPVGWRPIESTTGRLGLTLRTVTQFTEKVYLSPAVQVSVWHEFAGRTRAELLNPALPVQVSTDRVGTYGQVSVGVTVLPVATPSLTGFVRGDLRFGGKVDGWALNFGVRNQF
ncbi:MAG: autotransporter domain-containing protein [Rhizobiales bacterium]|nr:autotransporter domain-containing protein [Hyphomicrobiales bacterium]